ncbi:MAG TPA: hypothetical protein VGG18_14555 [Granulicella sp.]
MARISAIFATILLSGCFATAQQPTSPNDPAAAPAQTAMDSPEKPLPNVRELLLEAERNEKTIEAQQKDYTYHVHQEDQELDGKGNIKKTTMVDAESLTIDGVRVDRIVARDGKPLTDNEKKKEDERINKEVAKDRERREKAEGKGEATNSRGDAEISASRVLELGTFSNPRREMLDGRPTIVVDYAGDPNAKTRNRAEGVIRDLVGTVWIDEADRTMVRGEGHFLNDFKIGGGLVADVKKGSNFSFRAQKVNGEAWLPVQLDGQGKIRVLLFAGFNGHIHVVTSDYRKFRATTTILGSNGVIGPDGQPLPADPTQTPDPDPKTAPKP